MPPIYNFDPHQQYTSIDKLPDFRSDEEKQNSPLSVYNHDSNDIAYAERQVEEIVNISGAWVIVYNRTRSPGKDEVWEEDADPTFKNAIRLKGFFAPQSAEAQLNKWGVDVENKLTIHFSRATVLKLFGEQMISEGATIILPHNTLSVATNTDLRSGVGNRMDRYRVIKSTDTGNFKYRWLYWSCDLENLTGDKSIDVEFSKERA